MQVWLTFEETGELLNCSAAAARTHAIANQWERRRGSDGITRVILPLDSARKFILGYATKQSATPHQQPERAERAAPLPEKPEPVLKDTITNPKIAASKANADARMCQRGFQQSVTFLADRSIGTLRLQPLVAELGQSRNVWAGMPQNFNPCSGRKYADPLAPGLHPRFTMSCWESARLDKAALC